MKKKCSSGPPGCSDWLTFNCVSTWLPLEVRLDQQIGLLDLLPVQLALLPLFRLSGTHRTVLSWDIRQSNNVKLMSTLTPTQSSVKWFSVGVGFDLPPRWFPQRRTTRELRYSPQFSPGFSPEFWHLIPGWGPKGFWGANGTIWVQKSLWGTGHTVRTQETYESGGHI